MVIKKENITMAAKLISVTPKGGDVLAVLQYFEERARAEGISLPEVEITSTELVQRFTKQVVNTLISVRFLHIEP